MGESDVEVAVRAALAGARVVRGKSHGPVERFGKGGGDFATDADLAAERAIRAVLAAARPEDGVLGEEFGGDGRGERVWLVDPLCGTLNFAAGTGLVAVNVALRVGGDVVAAAVADPFSGEVFWTDGNAARVRVDGRDAPLVPGTGARLVDVDVDIDPPSPNRERYSLFRLLEGLAESTAYRPRVVSTSLAAAWVAVGRRVAYVTDGDLRDSVHFAAAIALCRAAGCVVTGLAGQPLHTGVHGLVVAADADVHAGIIGMIVGSAGALQG